jgi:hypothetical protein
MTYHGTASITLIVILLITGCGNQSSIQSDQDAEVKQLMQNRLNATQFSEQAYEYGAKYNEAFLYFGDHLNTEDPSQVRIAATKMQDSLNGLKSLKPYSSKCEELQSKEENAMQNVMMDLGDFAQAMDIKSAGGVDKASGNLQNDLKVEQGIWNDLDNLMKYDSTAPINVVSSH